MIKLKNINVIIFKVLWLIQIVFAYSVKKKKKKTVEGNQNHNRVQYSNNFFRVEILREIGDRLATVVAFNL